MSRPKKHYMPLESNPLVFTHLISSLGLTSLSFTDVYSLDDADLLSCVPRPALALVLVFPTTETYQRWKREGEERREVYGGKGEEEDVVWYRQTIGNACGLYGILHAVSNGGARALIEPESPLSNLINTCVPLSPTSRAIALEDSPELASAHADAGARGDTAAPDRPDVEVDYHYLCFVPGNNNPARKVYELDGDKKGPVFTGVTLDEGEDMLAEKVVKLVRDMMGRDASNIGFSLMALVPSEME